LRDEAEHKGDSEAVGVGARRCRDAEGVSFVKVEAVVIRERIETVIDAVEEQASHVGVTVIEAVGHGRERGITHEYRGRVFESRFLPKALLVFVAEAARADAIVNAIADAAQSGNDSGDGIVWTTPVENVTHNRTGMPLEEAE
jgi:nitrogen regulatory protein P-II 1